MYANTFTGSIFLFRTVYTYGMSRTLIYKTVTTRFLSHTVTGLEITNKLTLGVQIRKIDDHRFQGYFLNVLARRCFRRPDDV